jgi:hypothetical protein
MNILCEHHKHRIIFGYRCFERQVRHWIGILGLGGI